MRDKRNVYRIFIGKAEGKRLFGYSRHRREDNIKMYLKQSEKAAWAEFSWFRLELPKVFLAFRLAKRHEGVGGMEVHHNAFLS